MYKVIFSLHYKKADADKGVQRIAKYCPLAHVEPKDNLFVSVVGEYETKAEAVKVCCHLARNGLWGIITNE